MYLVKIKSWQEVRDSGLFRVEVMGDMVQLIRKNVKGDSGICLSLDYFGTTVLVTDHTAIHSNALKLVPELLQEVVGDGYVSSNHHKKVSENYNRINSLRNNNHHLEIAALKEQLRKAESALAVEKNRNENNFKKQMAKFTDVKANAKILSLEAQLKLSKSHTNKWRHRAHQLGDDTTHARKSEEHEIHELGQKVYKEKLKDDTKHGQTISSDITSS